MGSFGNMERLCRLCGEESQDLIKLFENPSSNRNLVPVLKKYIRVTVNIRDELPHQICGACVAKLDEVVDFVDICCATQTRLKKVINDCHLYELIQDVKVELEEEAEDRDADDLSDIDYGPKSRRKRTVKARGMRGRRSAVRGSVKNVTRRTQDTQVLAQEVPEPVKGSEDEVKMSFKETSGHKADENTGDSIAKDDAYAEEANSEQNDNTLHCERVESKTKYPVRCSICKAAFDYPEDLKPHCTEAHQMTETRYMCSHCPQSFLKITSLGTHLRRKHSDSLQRCPKCKKVYPSYYLWTRHMLVHTNTRPFICDECNKKFKSKAELYSHKKTHRPSEERYTHCCEVCGKRFTQKANLESHLRLHSGSKPFACEFCGKTFAQRCNMEEHRRIHTGEKPFECDVCGVRYSRQGQLAVHRKSHTGEKPHKCQFCGKKFLRKEVLRKHELVHTDTRPFKCSFCDKWFRDQGKRKVHERLHTGERPYECKFCNRGFCESGNLKKHLRVHQRSTSAIIASSATSLQEVDAQVAALETNSVIVESGEASYSTAVDSHSTFTCIAASSSRQNIDIVTDPSLLIVPDSASLGSQGSQVTCTELTSSGSSLPLEISANANTHELITSRPDEASHEAEEREDEYRVTSAVPFQSVAWALYQT